MRDTEGKWMSKSQQRALFSTTLMPRQGVRQRLRDFLRKRGITEVIRIDRNHVQHALIVTSRTAIELPSKFDGHLVHGRVHSTFPLNLEDRLVRDGKLALVPTTTGAPKYVALFQPPKKELP